jgi:hypothetical protein
MVLDLESLRTLDIENLISVMKVLKVSELQK